MGNWYNDWKAATLANPNVADVYFFGGATPFETGVVHVICMLVLSNGERKEFGGIDPQTVFTEADKFLATLK